MAFDQGYADALSEIEVLRRELAERDATIAAVLAVLHKPTPAPCWVVPKSELREALGLPVPVRAARR